MPQQSRPGGGEVDRQDEEEERQIALHERKKDLSPELKRQRAIYVDRGLRSKKLIVPVAKCAGDLEANPLAPQSLPQGAWQSLSIGIGLVPE